MRGGSAGMRCLPVKLGSGLITQAAQSLDLPQYYGQLSFNLLVPTQASHGISKFASPNRVKLYSLMSRHNASRSLNR